MKSIRALNAFGRTIVSGFSSRTYCGGAADCCAGRSSTLLPPVKPRFIFDTESEHQFCQPLSAIASRIMSAESSPDAFLHTATGVPSQDPIYFHNACRDA